jgi:sulfate adenylyltransferase subunit 2
MVTVNMLNYLQELEAESTAIVREVAAQFERPIVLYSAGKDSSVLLHLIRKAFYPARFPFPLLHVDTGFKFAEMYEFRDRTAKSLGAELVVYRNEEAIANGANPRDLGTSRCCALLKTEALLDALKVYRVDAAIGGARRDEEKSRAKERIFSFRDRFGQWEPRNQRPELWGLYNGKIRPDESIRVFPLSNWTEQDIWYYIKQEQIEIVPLYFAKKQSVIVQDEQLIPVYGAQAKDKLTEEVMCRFRTLGCHHCTGAVRSNAVTLDQIIAEMEETNVSERSTRIIDHDTETSMETKKREGYF